MRLIHVRAAVESDLAVMQDIERAAGSWFREIADDEPLPLEELGRYRQDNRAWVAVDDDDVPVQRGAGSGPGPAVGLDSVRRW